MPVSTGDIKLYKSDISGNIDLNAEIIDITTLFEPALAISADVAEKIWIKNTHATDTLNITKFYTVNGFTITNTNNTPINIDLTELYSNITPGLYSLSFPLINSVIVTPPSGIARPAQSIICDGITQNTVFMLDDLPIQLVFNNTLTTADQATIKFSDAGTFIYISDDDGANSALGYYQKTSYTNGINIGDFHAGDTYPVHIKQSIPTGVTNQNNPRKWIPIVLGNAI